MTDYELIQNQIREIIKTEPYYVSALSNISAIIMDSIDELNWAGFYLLREGELLVGPFQGKPACIHIEAGRGVCGSCLVQDRTLVVPDVHKFPGHIMCDSVSKSEIVLPIHHQGQVVAVLDIDSPVYDRFTGADQTGLEAVVKIIEELVEW